MTDGIDFDAIERGMQVKLRQEHPGRPKPAPFGWQTVSGVDIDGFVRVVGDPRWLPMSLIEDVREEAITERQIYEATR